jgi:hypothetical protein
MKTLIVFNEIESLGFAIVDGDYSRFNGVMFNSMMRHDHEQECGEFIFNDETGYMKIDFTNDISLVENKEWDKVALITFLP